MNIRGMCEIMETVDQQISATLDSTDNMSINTYYIYILVIIPLH